MIKTITEVSTTPDRAAWNAGMPVGSILITADRGGLKAYRVEETPNRGHVARLCDSLEIPEAHERYRDMVTDQAGAFPTGGSDGQGNSIAEKMTFDEETETRIFREVGARITQLLHTQHPEQWAFAAPSEINGAILANVARDLKQTMRRNVARDLIHTDPRELLAYFQRPSL